MLTVDSASSYAGGSNLWQLWETYGRCTIQYSWNHLSNTAIPSSGETWTRHVTLTSISYEWTWVTAQLLSFPQRLCTWLLILDKIRLPKPLTSSSHPATWMISSVPWRIGKQHWVPQRIPRWCFNLVASRWSVGSSLVNQHPWMLLINSLKATPLTLGYWVSHGALSRIPSPMMCPWTSHRNAEVSGRDQISRGMRYLKPSLRS